MPSGKNIFSERQQGFFRKIAILDSQEYLVYFKNPKRMICRKRPVVCRKDVFRGGKNKNPTPERSGVGYKVFHGSTLVAVMLPLIDALTGAPGPAFPPDGSEVVDKSQGLQRSRTKMSASLGSLRFAVVFVNAFRIKTITQNPAAVNRRKVTQERWSNDGNFRVKTGGKGS